MVTYKLKLYRFRLGRNVLRQRIYYWILHFLGGNFITLKSKKHTIVSRSTADFEYRAMAHISCKLMWIKHLLEELIFDVKLSITMYYMTIKQQYILTIILREDQAYRG